MVTRLRWLLLASLGFGAGLDAAASGCSCDGARSSRSARARPTTTQPRPISPIRIDAKPDVDPGGSANPPRVLHYCACGPGADADCKPGSDDEGDGSADRPHASLEAARKALLAGACGDAVLLCRGGSFDVWQDSTWTVAGEVCPAGNYRKLGVYTPPWASGDETHAEVRGATTFFNHVSSERVGGGMEVEGLRLHCVDCSREDKHRGFRFYGPQRSWLIEDVIVDGFGFGIQLGSDGKRANAADIVVARSSIVNSTITGILGAADRMVVHHTVFRNNACTQLGAGEASKCAFDHAWYIDGGENPKTGHSRFSDVVLRDSVFQDNCNLGGTGRCACAVVVNRGQTRLRIEGNTFVSNLDYGPECIAIDGTGTSSDRGESCIDCAIRDNTFLGGWSRAIAVDGSPRLAVESNRIQVLQGPTHPVHCAGVSIEPKKDGRGGKREELASEKVSIRNNEIFFRADMGESDAQREECIGIAVAGEAGGHVITGNAIYMEGHGELDCFSIDGDPAAIIAEMNDNTCARGGPGTSFDWNKAGEDLDAWRARAPGLDSRSRVADPGFVAPAAPYPATRFRAAAPAGDDR